MFFIGISKVTTQHCNYAMFLLLLLFLIFAIPMKAFSDSLVSFSREYGGAGGAHFVEMVSPQGSISGITISAGSRIDNIRLTYKYRHRSFGRSFGGSGGTAKSFTLRNGEYIKELGGKAGRFVYSIYIKTNRDRYQRWGGNGGNRSFRFTGTRNSPIKGIWGRSGDYIDAIGVIKGSSNSNFQTRSNLSQFKLNRKSVVKKNWNLDCGDKCDSITNPLFPIVPTNDRDLKFLRKQNNKLGALIRKLVHSSKFNKYIDKTEKQHCNNHIYCEIDTKGDLLTHLIGAR